MGLPETLADRLPGTNPAPLASSLEVAFDAEDARQLRIEEARGAHARGWVLTPLRGKRPILSGWTTAPEPSPELVEEWALSGNLGLRTGRVSGIVAIDDDTLDGDAARSLRLPETPTVITGSGKLHHYFLRPPAGLPNSVSRLAAGVDVRGEGGQVVFVGSIHPETGRPYLWAQGLSPREVPLAELPHAILVALTSPRSSRRNDRDASARASTHEDPLENAAARIASTAKGRRNDTLNAEAFRIGRLVSRGTVPEPVALDTLHEAGCRSGLAPAEVERTVESGFRAGTTASRTPGSRTDRAPVDARQGRRSLNGSATIRPTIVVEGGQLPEQVDQAELALLSDERGENIYQRGGLLVRICRLDAERAARGVEHTAGSLVIQPVEVPYLVERFTRVAEWAKWDGRRNDYKTVDCPENVARTYLARRGEWRLPTLRGIVEAPTIRPDGSVLSEPGYDSSTGLYFAPGGVAFAPIPRDPGLDEARAGLQEILHLLHDFPWVAESDRAAALSAILTALVRRSLRSAPLFAFRAPVMASGKSLLADLVAMMSTGRVASCITHSGNETEDQKRIFALLMEGTVVACIDNVERPLGGAALCSVLTQESYRDRILGRSETATVPTRTTWLATGNNLVLAGDVSTRVVPCDLDPKQERPEERSFELDLHDYVPRHRGELVPAALTILHAYNKAGRPDQGLCRFGRFEEWSDLVRSALVWCGEADPCDGRARLAASDPVRQRLATMLLQWNRVLGSNPSTAGDAIRTATERRTDEPDFHGILCEIAGDRAGNPDARRLGIWLSQNERRRERGLRVERCGERQGSALWQVVAERRD